MDKGGFNSNKKKISAWLSGTIGRLLKTVCTLVFIACFIIIVLPGSTVREYFGVSDNENSNSLIIKREALPQGSVNETAYFTENYHIDDPIAIEEGLKHFYELTGVQPYVEIITLYGSLYITNGPDITQDLDAPRDLTAYTRARYSQLFTDESHLLLVFLDVDSYLYTMAHHHFCIVTGSNAKTVIDGKAEKILLDNIESCFDDLGISEEMFSNAFSDAADRIMGVKEPQTDKTVFIILGALALLVLLVRLRRAKKKRKLKEQKNKEILNRPLEEYGADSCAKAETTAQEHSSFSGGTTPAGAGCDTLPKDDAEILAEKYSARSKKRRP